ncbi:hypothetical protein CA13_00200 [Planctomycetes bacterium CA13]|uniref:Uncharacterized protein n=1 Tax=Novipirellula herctigrandis TaxID=2527986 RepID=A0A5C5YUF9_9BACT|nr:hypothetical protein CA13_00200 [Planctomycetes bacterium CA13]
MLDDPISDRQRESLDCYVQSEGQEITPRFVFRFYISRLLQWAMWFAAIAVLAKLFIPADITLSLRYTAILCIACFYIAFAVLSIWSSFASVEHWRLLKRILNWDEVHRLHKTKDATGE